MIVSLLLLVGCQQDLLLLGDVTGLASAGTTTLAMQLPTPAPEPLPTGGAPADVRAAEVPPGEVPPGEGSPAENVAVAGVAEEVPAVAPPNPSTFNPISIPEGPREGDGVRWEGVKVKGRAPQPVGVRTRGTPDMPRR